MTHLHGPADKPGPNLAGGEKPAVEGKQCNAEIHEHRGPQGGLDGYLALIPNQEAGRLSVVRSASRQYSRAIHKVWTMTIRANTAVKFSIEGGSWYMVDGWLAVEVVDMGRGTRGFRRGFGLRRRAISEELLPIGAEKDLRRQHGNGAADERRPLRRFREKNPLPDLKYDRAGLFAPGHRWFDGRDAGSNGTQWNILRPDDEPRNAPRSERTPAWGLWKQELADHPQLQARGKGRNSENHPPVVLRLLGPESGLLLPKILPLDLAKPRGAMTDTSCRTSGRRGNSGRNRRTRATGISGTFHMGSGSCRFARRHPVSRSPNHRRNLTRTKSQLERGGAPASEQLVP